MQPEVSKEIIVNVCGAMARAFEKARAYDYLLETLGTWQLQHEYETKALRAILDRAEKIRAD
jgi:hypothetical protein